MAAIGAASYTEDPMVQFDITLTPTTNFTGSVTDLQLIVEYTAGD